MERLEEKNMQHQNENPVIVGYDVFYTNSELDPGMKEGWYFWFVDQDDQIVSEPIGPWNNPNEAMTTGRIAVKTYYDHDDES
jgi:hypothetical protein